MNQKNSDYSLLPENTPGQRLKKLRLTAGLSQVQLSKQLGFTANYYGQVERDAKDLSKNMTNSICKYFNVTYDYLFQGLEPEQLHEAPAYDCGSRALLSDYIRGCSEEECRMLEPIIRALVEALRRANWFPEKTRRPRRRR